MGMRRMGWQVARLQPSSVSHERYANFDEGALPESRGAAWGLLFVRIGLQATSLTAAIRIQATVAASVACMGVTNAWCHALCKA